MAACVPTHHDSPCGASCWGSCVRRRREAPADRGPWPRSRTWRHWGRPRWSSPWLRLPSLSSGRGSHWVSWLRNGRRVRSSFEQGPTAPRRYWRRFDSRSDAAAAGPDVVGAWRGGCLCRLRVCVCVLDCLAVWPCGRVCANVCLSTRAPPAVLALAPALPVPVLRVLLLRLRVLLRVLPLLAAAQLFLAAAVGVVEEVEEKERVVRVVRVVGEAGAGVGVGGGGGVGGGCGRLAMPSTSSTPSRRLLQWLVSSYGHGKHCGVELTAFRVLSPRGQPGRSRSRSGLQVKKSLSTLP